MKEKIEQFGKKNLIIACVFIISIIIILFGGALLYNKLFYKKSYSEVEEIMKEAAKEYFKTNKEKLPKNINDTIIVEDTSLVNNGNMSTIDDYIKNREITCSGKVKVTNINGSYRYTPYLDCGESYYQTKDFNSYITNNINIVTSGNGLYELNDALVYRGDSVNNYLKLNNKFYRIVKFVDGKAVVIYTDKLTAETWDDRYNIERDDYSGINDYSVSRIREYLNTLYNSTGSDAFLSDENKLLVVQYDLAIGKRGPNDTDKTGALENSAILTKQYIGLLPVSDFLNASSDVNCISTLSKACSNYNYLSAYKYNWWTGTASNENTYKVYRINKTVSSSSTSSNSYVRPVLYLASDAIYVSGNGTATNPYIVK